MQVAAPSWQPTASLTALRARARLLQQLRQFFAQRDVLEVETPLLCQATVTDRFIQSMMVGGRYLQTSPEYAMKRLLAAGSGSIFQIAKSFRDEESGRIHNPEFTMLEWYRVGYCLSDLMDEISALLVAVLSCPPAQRMSYSAVFLAYCDLDPHTCATSDLVALASESVGRTDLDRDTALQAIFSMTIEPQLGHDRPMMIYDFPASQAALARVRPGVPACAERVEVFVQGLEMGNGFYELSDSAEQRQRFRSDQLYREAHQLPCPDMDERLLAALAHGLPDCAGMAIGVDRLLLCLLKESSLSSVISFDWTSA